MIDIFDFYLIRTLCCHIGYACAGPCHEMFWFCNIMRIPWYIWCAGTVSTHVYVYSGLKILKNVHKVKKKSIWMAQRQIQVNHLNVKLRDWMFYQNVPMPFLLQTISSCSFLMAKAARFVLEKKKSSFSQKNKEEVSKLTRM